ncbi:MAG: ParA family protein [Christensenella sp.]|uniref:ParA family protein n=1 Tax=Christensenella sp. TaxID=1935934 RepID=UPI002B212317|nr:ParA family protein [Christensenella sp.]MEA5003944.1 ParA family protein [Christensenella sp.]
MERYAFWNNKGGTGKTSLAFQVICDYAYRNPNQKVLAIDVCPQANLSELLLGGLHNGGSDNLLKRQGVIPRATVGGYFQMRLPAPYSPPSFTSTDFITTPHDFNSFIPVNIDLFCGDPLLELQSNAISTLANNQIPGTNTWVAIIDWINDFLSQVDGAYDVVFFDANPSFSIYTQIALAATSRLILPVMADDSSRRAIQNAFSLVYGLKLPSEIYTKYAFAEKLKDASRPLPKVHMVLKNRLTQYMGPASAYATVLSAIDKDVDVLLRSNPEIFSFNAISNGITDVRDFQTTGVVANARGCPFYMLRAGRLDILGQRVQIKEEYRQNCEDNIKNVSVRSITV